MGVTEVDIAVVGCGMVGTPLALALADQGWRVAVIDRSPPPALPVDDLDQRCTALSAITVDEFRRRGLWNALADDACAIEHVHVSQRGYFGATRMSARELALPSLGQVVENRRVIGSLQARLTAGHVDLWQPATPESLQTTPTGITLQVRHEGEVHAVSARLLIAVDGVGSAVRDWLGIGTRQVDYDQSAVLGCAAIERPHAHVAHERFTADGPLAMLPRPGRVVSFVHCIAPSDAIRVRAADEASYRAELQTAFGLRLGRLQALGPRTVVPLLRIEAHRQIGERVLLLGNAARLLHPIAGQGYNLAMRDAAALLDLLGSTDDRSGIRDQQRVDDPGSGALLTRYIERRRPDQQRIVRLTDALARGFRGHQSWLAHLRGLGLNGLDTVAPLRRAFARTSMGLR